MARSRIGDWRAAQNEGDVCESNDSVAIYLKRFRRGWETTALRFEFVEVHDGAMRV
jgi:hypothetical protein